jgi:arsenate reductase
LFSNPIDEFNPQADFCRILTCSSADGACPFILVKEKELPSPLKTLRLFNTLNKRQISYQRSMQIATEPFTYSHKLKINMSANHSQQQKRKLVS